MAAEDEDVGSELGSLVWFAVAMLFGAAAFFVLAILFWLASMVLG